MKQGLSFSKELFAIFLTIVALTAIEASAQNETPSEVTFGEIQVAGTACRLKGIDLGQAELVDGVLQIPTAISLKKAAGTALARGTCNLAVSVKVAPGYRLEMSELEAPLTMNLAKASSLKAHFEVFKAGQVGESLDHQEVAGDRRLRKTTFLKKEAALISSRCGDEFILRMNSSLLLQQGEGRSTAGIEFAQMKAEVVACD